MFDYVRVEDGKIVDRIQQTDMFGHFGQLLLGALIVLCVLLVGIGVADRRAGAVGAVSARRPDLLATTDRACGAAPMTN